MRLKLEYLFIIFIFLWPNVSSATGVSNPMGLDGLKPYEISIIWAVFSCFTFVVGSCILLGKYFLGKKDKVRKIKLKPAFIKLGLHSLVTGPVVLSLFILMLLS